MNYTHPKLPLNRSNDHARLIASSTLAKVSYGVKDCTAVFKGGASDPIQTGIGIGIGVLGLLPGLGDVAKWMGKVVNFLKPDDRFVISGESVYSCISEFVEQAIDQKVSESLTFVLESIEYKSFCRK